LIFQGLPRAHRTRLLVASVALAASVMLAGCQVEGPYSVAKHMKPLSSEMVATLEGKGMSKASPMLIRVFKEEAELEIWKQDSGGQFALLKTYPICRWSGELGPKTREGDRQAPEGFYNIKPTQMNPNSAYYLSFDLGYPNAFDRAYGRTGAQLMVHGDCSSRGCYSMTDEQIAEIFALGRDAFFGGQRSFQVQAYPFRMTALNMAKHRNSPHMSFWKNLKEGYDNFEMSRQEPKVDVCEKRYVFNAQAPAGSTTPLSFQAAGKCPAFEVPQEISSAVRQKTQRDETALADFIRRGTPTVPVKTGRDGGMHPSFAAIYQSHEVRDAKGNLRGVVTEKRPQLMPGDYPVQVASTPSVSTPDVSTASVGTPSSVPMPRAVPGRPRVAAASSSTASAYSSAPQSGSSFGGFLGTDSMGKAASSVANVFGWGKSEPPPAPAARTKSRPGRPASHSPASHTPASPGAAPAAVAAKPAAAPKGRQAAPVPSQTQTAAQTAEATPPAPPARGGGLVTGAQPVIPSGSFDQRWGGSNR
jgi:murein L,D-transpeptidase YafK